MKKLIQEKEEQLKNLITSVGDKLVQQITASGKHKALRLDPRKN